MDSSGAGTSKDAISMIGAAKNASHGPIGNFTCQLCRLKEKYDYVGTKPPFARPVTFLEDCYIMRDPFSAVNRGQVLILGAHCHYCEIAVCMDCSMFYVNRICAKCLCNKKSEFPSNLQGKINKLVNSYCEKKV